MRLSVWLAALCMGTVALALQDAAENGEPSPVSGSDTSATGDTPADPVPVEEAPEEDDSVRPKRWYYPQGFNNYGYGYPWNNGAFGPGNFPAPPGPPFPTGRTRPAGARPQTASLNELVNYMRFNDIAYQRDRQRQWMANHRYRPTFPDVIDTAASNNFRPNFNPRPNTFGEIHSRTRIPGQMQPAGSFNAPFIGPQMRPPPSNFNPNFNPANNFNPNFNPANNFNPNFYPGNNPGALPPSFPY